MSSIAYGLIASAILAGIAAKYFAPDNVIYIAVSALIFLTGSLFFLISGLVRIWQGKTVLRPFDALRNAVRLFLMILGLRTLLWWVFFPKTDHDFNLELISSAAFAIVFGLYNTAYRAPA